MLIKAYLIVVVEDTKHRMDLYGNTLDNEE